MEGKRGGEGSHGLSRPFWALVFRDDHYKASVFVNLLIKMFALEQLSQLIYINRADLPALVNRF